MHIIGYIYFFTFFLFGFFQERKSGKTTDSKILWGTFQFAFKVYSFAGGQDDRADALTRELAQEIEADSPQQYH